MKNQELIIKEEGKGTNLNPSKGESKKDQSIDKKNIDSSIEGESKKKNSNFKSELFSWNPSKKERSSIRGKRDRLMRSINKFHLNKDKESRDEKIKEFISFYKENYKKNDYSLESISFKNSSPSSKEEIQDFFKSLKRWKIK